MIALFILLILLIILPVVVLKKVGNPLTIIGAWWGFWLLLSLIGFNNMYTPAKLTVKFILINLIILIFFGMISLFFKKIKIKSSKKIIKFNLNIILFNVSKIIIIIQLLILFNICYLIISGRISYLDIRSIIFDGEKAKIIFFGNINLWLIYTSYIKSFIIFDALKAIINLFKNKKMEKISFFNIILYTVIVLGRVELMRLMVFSLLAVMFIADNNKERKKIRNNIIYICLAVMILVSFVRVNPEQSLIMYIVEGFFSYFTAPFIAIDYLFNNMLYEFTDISPSLFNPILGGLTQFLRPILNVLNISFTEISNIIATIFNRGIVVSYNGDIHNAFYTMYGSLVIEAGILGSLIYSAIIGIVIGRTYSNYIKFKTYRALFINVFVTHLVIMGVLRWDLDAGWTWGVVLLIFLYINSIEDEGV